jgi:tetratricopeptide (TPR) repeat protein/transglutaminase-like putative cysteine protease
VDWPVPRGPSREPVPYKYDFDQWKQVPQEFLDDAPACVLYSGINYLIEPDGTIETITHEIIRLNSRKALQDLGEYRSISYTPAYEKLTLNVAQVCKPNGRCVPVEPKNVQLRDAGTDFQVYDTSKQLVISYPSLEVGDVIEVKWTTRGKNPEHQGQFFARYTFGADTYPIVTDEMRVRLPKDRILKYQTTGGKLDPVIAEEGGNRTYHWRASNRRQLPQDEHLPSKEHLRLQASCSTFASWEDVHKWKQQLRKECWNCTPEVRQIIQDVTKDLQTPLEKARALTYWVRRHIRYVSVGEKHDYTPHTPVVVLNNRYGDCKDSSQLLAVMLKEVGIPVALATLGVRDDGQVLEDVPSPWGTHAILLVTIDGSEHWIDTTASLAGWNFLPRDDRDRLCYIVDDKGIRLERTPALKPEDNRIEQNTRVTIGADGSTRCDRTATFHGIAALQRRNDWVEVPVGERRRQLTNELQDANSKTRLSLLQLDEARLKNYDLPVPARMVFDVLDQFGDDPDKPGNREGSLTDSKIWSNLLWYNLDYDRTVPMELDMPFESVHVYTVQMPPWFALDGRLQNREVRSRWGSFRVTIKAEADNPRQIEIKYHTRVEKTRVDPEDFDAFHKFHDDVLKHYRVWLNLAPVKDASQAPLLGAVLQLTPGDGAVAVLLAEMYLSNHQKKEARQVLDRVRRYHPDSPRLGELAIKAAANLKEEEVVYRDLIKTAPQEQKYALALGQNLAEQGKHADARTALKTVLQKGTTTQKSLAYYQLARSSMQEKKAEQALEHFEAAEDADPEMVHTVGALRFKANLLEQLNRPGDAAKAYRKVLEVDPDMSEALAALVRLELAANRRDEAVDYLRRYSVAVGKDGAGLAQAADYHLRLGRYEDAFDLANRAREVDGNIALAQRTLGLVYLRRGNFSKAAFHLERADLDSQVLEGMIKSRLAQGKLHLAVQDADQSEKIQQPSANLMKICETTRTLVQRRKAILAEVQVPADQREQWTEAIDQFVCAEHGYRSGRLTAAIEVLVTESLANGVELGTAYGLRALLAMEKGRLAGGLADSERAIALSPKEATGYYVRGRIRLERAQPGALIDLRKAAELSSRKDASVLHWLALALHRDGQKADAVAAQREALQLRPKDPELIQQLKEFEK